MICIAQIVVVKILCTKNNVASIGEKESWVPCCLEILVFLLAIKAAVFLSINVWIVNLFGKWRKMNEDTVS